MQKREGDESDTGKHVGINSGNNRGCRLQPEDEHEAWIKHIKERAKVLRAEKEARIAEEKADAAEQKAIKGIISICKKLKSTKEGTIHALAEEYGLSVEEAEKRVE